MNYKIFCSSRTTIQGNVVTMLNDSFRMSVNTMNSPRAVGDAVQEFLEEHFKECLPSGVVKQFDADFARRAMADFAFTDTDDNYYVIDSKTHNLTTVFNMPNLISVERIARFYENPKDFFCILMTSYMVESGKLCFKDCTFIPIEWIDWSCLNIGALGWGQIQISNSNNLKINPENTRKKWMLELCNKLDEFYPNEILKIKDRMSHFKGIREYWEQQPD